MKPHVFTHPRQLVSNLVRLGIAFLLLAGLFLIARAAEGDLDPTFGINSSGVNFTDFDDLNQENVIYGLALQTDNKIVAVGQSNLKFAVARYLSSGLLDTAGFGAPKGTVVTTINKTSAANAVAMQEDGKIVAVGFSSDGTRDYFTVARYNSNGSLDTANFNSPNGYVASALSTGSDVATSVVIQSDGKIVVAGYASNQFVVARYNSNGTLDTTGFNSPNGFITISIGASDRAQAVGLQSDEKIILAGHADTGTSDDFAVARVTTAGVLDTTFNGGLGFITTDFPTDQIDLGQALAIQIDDKIVVAGYTNDGYNEDFALARYQAEGGLDAGFGTSGLVKTAINSDDQAFAVAVESTGRIFAAGMTLDPVNTEDIAVVAYTSAGVLDTNFSVDGKVATNFGSVLGGSNLTADFAEAILIQSDWRIVVGGYTDHPEDFGDNNFAIVRYEAFNHAPVVSGFAKSGNEDQQISLSQAEFSAHFSDPDGDSLAKVKITELPPHGTLKLSGVNVTLNQEIPALQLDNLVYVPNQDYHGSDSFTWNGSDSQDYAAADAQVDITLSAINDPPVNSVPGPLSIIKNTASSPLVFSISDVDAGSALNFQFTLSAANGNLSLASTTGLTLIAGSNNSHSMTYQGSLANINAALGAVTYTPDLDYTGSDAITLNSNDNGSSGSGGPLQDTDLVDVTVTFINSPPILDPIGNQSGNEGQAITFDANASDVNSGQTLTFSLDPGAPTGASIDPSSGAFSWTPGESDGSGVFPVTVRVSDGSDSDSETIDITVNETNSAPVLDAISNKVVNEDAQLAFTATASDGDLPANTLSFSLAAGAPSGAAIDPASGAFTWTPAEADSPGVYNITVQVADNGAPVLSDSQVVQITVNEVNDAPTFTAGPNQTVNEDTGAQTVAAWATAISPGPGNESSQTLTFHLTTDNNPLFSTLPAINASTGDLTYTPAANAHGTATVSVTLQDNGGTANGGVDSSSAQFTITVNPVNDLPAVSDITLVSPTGAVSFTLANFTAGFSDVDGDALALVKITWLPTNGVLNLNGVPVTVGQEIAAGAIDQLTFTPDADWHGTSIFGWNGSDGAGYATNEAEVMIYSHANRIFVPLVLH